MLTTPHHKIWLWYDLSNGKVLCFGTLYVRRLYRLGSLTTVARELVTYKLEVMGVQEIWCDKGGKVRARDYNVICGKGSANHQLGT